MQINFVNWPAALVTIVFRRFIDYQFGIKTHRTFNTRQWGFEDIVKPGVFYVYCFGALITYIAKHISRGTIVNMATKCSSTAVSLRDNYIRKKRWMKKNRSWILQNLLSTRHHQERALSYLSDMSDDTIGQRQVKRDLRSSTPNLCNYRPSPDHDTCHKQSQTTYYSVIDHPVNKQIYTGNTITESMQDVINRQIRNYKEDYGRERDMSIISSVNENDVKNSVCGSESANGNCSASLILDLYTPSIIEEIMPSECSGNDNDSSVFKHPRNDRKQAQKKRSKDKKLHHRDNKLIRRTRSGKIYGYMRRSAVSK